MIAQNFEYAAPSSLKDALGLLTGDDVKVLAGGMSLIPLMKLRLATPGQLVDIGRRIERHFGSHQDVEWAIARGQQAPAGLLTATCARGPARIGASAPGLDRAPTCSTCSPCQCRPAHALR